MTPGRSMWTHTSLPRQGGVPLTADTATLVAFQVTRAAAGDSDSTIRRRWSALSSFYEFALDRQLTSTNPTVGVVRPKVLAGDVSPTLELSAEAVASARAVAAALDPRLDAPVALIVADGLKVVEALALDIGDVVSKRPATTITIGSAAAHVTANALRCFHIKAES